MVQMKIILCIYIYIHKYHLINFLFVCLQVYILYAYILYIYIYGMFQSHLTLINKTLQVKAKIIGKN